MPLRVLHDEKRRPFVRHQVMPTAAGPLTQWDTIVEFVTAIETLTKPGQVGFASETYAKLFPHCTGSAIAADKIGGSNFSRSAVRRPDGRHDTWPILLEL